MYKYLYLLAEGDINTHPYYVQVNNIKYINLFPLKFTNHNFLINSSYHAL